MYTRARFARLNRVTLKTVRHYERLGLLAPMRTATGYRRYSVADAGRLERILALKSLGLPLKTIKALIAGRDVSLRDHRERLEEKRVRLDRAIDVLKDLEQDTRPPGALGMFVREAAWDRSEIERQKCASVTPRPPDRAPESHIALFREISELASSPWVVDFLDACTQT